MNKSILSFFKQSTSYVCFNLLEKLIPFVMLPIIIRQVSVGGYGDYSFFLTLETVLVPIFSLNISNMVYREYYKQKNSLAKYVSTLFWGYLRLCLLFILPFFLFTLIFKAKLAYSTYLFGSLFLTASLISFIDIVTLVLRLEQKAWKYGIWQIFRSLLLMSSLLIAVYIIPSFEWLVYSRVFTFILVFIISVFVLRKKRLLENSFDVDLFKVMVKFSLPTVVYSFSSFLFSFSDRFVIKNFLGSESLGIYSGIYQLSSALSILVVAFNVAWMPWLFDKLSSETLEAKKEVVKISYLLISLFVLAGVCWSIIYPFLASKMLTDVYDPYLFIGWLMIFSFVFHGIYCVVSPYTYYVGKTKINGYIGFSVALINVVLNLLLVPLIGIAGSAIALLVTWMFQAVSFFVVGVKIYKMPWFGKY